MDGISIKKTIGVGDALQFSSVPENYFRATGRKIYDVSKPWFFDHNPYVCRDPNEKPVKVIEMWNFSPTQYQWPRPRQAMQYLSNAEIWAAVWGVPMRLNRPRLYKFEDYPFEKREMILLHTHGRSHGEMPKEIIDHVLAKYKLTGNLIHIGLPTDPYLGIPKAHTPTLWDLAELISRAKMLIGVDSGPIWVAACYPDVIVKKIRMRPDPDILKTWTPLAIDNVHSHWDDRAFQAFNPTKEDIGFTSAYTKI